MLALSNKTKIRLALSNKTKISGVISPAENDKAQDS